MRPESLEVIRRHRFVKHFRQLVGRRFGTTLNQKRTAALETKDRLRTPNRSVLHTRHRAQTILQLSQENNTLLFFGVFLSTQTHLRSHESIDAPSRIGVDETMQATQKQSRRCKKAHCERKLTDNQQMPQPVLRASGSRAARVLSKREVHIRARREPGRHSSEEHSGHE